MAEYIDREGLMKFPVRRDHCDKAHANEHFINGIETVMEYAKNLPAADVAPVVHASWIIQEDWGMDTYYTCSACKEDFVTTDGTPTDNLWDYCPHCGAKMDGGAEDA